jgi:sulfide dehydrogenase cytochrome subunit
MRRIKATIIACLLAVPAVSMSAGIDQVIKDCDGCHGKDGNSETGEVPSIAGMSVVYLQDTMDAYKTDYRPGLKYTPKGGTETDMNELSKKLSKDDISAVAEHYAGLTFKPVSQSVDAALAAKGKEIFESTCDKCHSKGGTDAGDDAGILGGQWKPYLQEQMKLFSEGKRPMPKKKEKKFSKLSDADKAAVVEFLAGGGK